MKRVLCLLAAALLLAGCEQTPASSRTPAPGPGGAAGGASGRARDTLTVAIAQEPDVLWATIGNMQAAADVRMTLSQGLTERDHRNVYQPRLAERTPTLENGGAKLVKTPDGREQLVVTYRIRQGARFSTGDPVTAEDVKYSWQLTLHPEVPAVARTVATYYERIDTPDARTVVVTYRPGQLDPLYYSFCCQVVSKNAFSTVAPGDLAKSPLARSPVYAGPYRLKQWIPGSAITVEANADFWLGAPKIKTIVFRFVNDQRTLLAQLRSGEIDVATNDALTIDLVPELDRLAAETDKQPSYARAQSWEHLDFNLRDPKDLARPHPVLGDRRVRQAIAMGIDRDALTRQILFGTVGSIDSFLFGGSWARAEGDITTYRFDPAAARALLDDAGWKVGADGIRERGGRRAELKLESTSGSRVREQTTAAMAGQLRAIGIKVSVELLPSTKWFATAGNGPLSAGTFDLGLYAWVLGDDPQTFFYSCSEIPTKENGFTGQNYPGYCSREFDAAIKAGNERLLPAERIPGYLAAQKIWTADLPALPLYQRLNIEVAPKNLRGFNGTSTNTPATFNAWEWEIGR